MNGFPALENVADLAVTFGDQSKPGVIHSVSYNVTGDQLLTVQVVPPQYTADSFWEDAGWVIAQSRLFLLSDPTVVATFYTMYLRPLAVARTAFQAQYSFVDLTFNQPTNGGTAGSRTVCSRLVDVRDLERMGHLPLNVSDDCIWQSASVLRILYKPLPSHVKAPLAPGDSLRVHGGGTYLQDDGNHKEMFLASHTVTVWNDPAPAAPEASLVGATVVGICEPLVLDASASKGTQLSYRWRCLNDDDLNDVLKTALEPTISIPPSLLLSKQDVAFLIAVSVTDFVGTTSSPRLVHVYRSSSPLPTVFIDSDLEIFVESDEGVSLYGKVEFSSCSEPSPMEFTWFGGQDGGDLPELGTHSMTGVGVRDILEQYELGGKDLHIYPNVLTPGQSYRFELLGAPLGEPWYAGSASVIVHVLLPALLAEIDGGDSRDVSNLKDIVLDGSKSHDPSGHLLKYDWSCVSRATNDICRHKTTHKVGGDTHRQSVCVFVCIDQDCPEVTDTFQRPAHPHTQDKRQETRDTKANDTCK